MPSPKLCLNNNGVLLYRTKSDIDLEIAQGCYAGKSAVFQAQDTGKIYQGGSGFLLDVAAPDGIFNFNKSAYAQVARSIKAMLAGTGSNVRIMVSADSIHGASINGVITTQMRQNSPSGQAAKLLTANGINTNIQSQWGLNGDYLVNGTLVTFAASDPRVALSNSFAYTAGAGTQPAIGNIVTSGGNTGVITGISITSGTFAGNNAVGIVTYVTTAGTFVAASTITASSGATMTCGTVAVWDNGVPPTVGFGHLHVNDASYASYFTYKPDTACDSIDIYYYDNNYNAFKVSDGSGNLLATCVPTNNQYVTKLTAKIPGGAKLGNSFAINFTASGAPTFYIQGYEAYDSSKPEISLINMGMASGRIASGGAGYIYGSSTSAYNTWPILTNASNTAEASAPDLLLVAYGINEMSAVGGAVTLAASYAAGATSIALAANWTLATGLYILAFSDGSTQTVTLTNGSTVVSAITALVYPIAAAASYQLAANLANYQAALDDTCLKALNFGKKPIPVALMTFPPSNFASYAWANPAIAQLYVNAIYTIAQKYGIAVIDVWGDFGKAYSVALANGWFTGDPVHENQAGSNEMGRLMATFLTLLAA